MGLDTQRPFHVDARANRPIKVRLYRWVLHVVCVNRSPSPVGLNRLNGGL